jgi:hypothetical protein
MEVAARYLVPIWLSCFLSVVVSFASPGVAKAQVFEFGANSRLGCEFCIDGELLVTRSSPLSEESSGRLMLRLGGELGLGTVGALLGAGVVYLAYDWYLSSRDRGRELALGLAVIVAVAFAGAGVVGAADFLGGRGDPESVITGALIGAIPGTVMVILLARDRDSSLERRLLTLAVLGAGSVLGAMVAYEITHQTGRPLGSTSTPTETPNQVELMRMSWSF